MKPTNLPSALKQTPGLVEFLHGARVLHFIYDQKVALGKGTAQSKLGQEKDKEGNDVALK